MSTPDIEDRRLFRSVTQIAENDRVMGHMGDRVEPFRVITLGVFIVPLVHAHGVASRVLVATPEQLTYWTAPLESS